MRMAIIDFCDHSHSIISSNSICTYGSVCNNLLFSSSGGLPSPLIRPNKTISVFRVIGLKILGRVGTHFFIIFFSGKNIMFCILKGISKCIKLYFFPENLEKNLDFTCKFN